MDHKLHVILTAGKSQRHKGGLPSSEGQTLQTKERRAMPMVTYSELIEFSMFIVTLIGLCYAIFKVENSRQLLALVDGLV